MKYTIRCTVSKTCFIWYKLINAWLMLMIMNAQWWLWSWNVKVKCMLNTEGVTILDPTLLTTAIDRYDLIYVCDRTKHWFVSLFKLKNFLYWIKNQQVEARDPHLPPSVRWDDYHDAGREDDSVSAVGGVFQWLGSLITITGWTWWSSSVAEDHPRTRMLREQSKNFYVPNIYHFV